MIHRFANNPLIHPGDVAPSRPDFEVLCAFNPGATWYDNRKLLLVRVAERPVQEKGYLSTVITDLATGHLNVLRYKLDDPDLDATDPRVFRYRGESYLTSLSHLRVATSQDGTNFTISPQPALTGSGVYETYGIEDARITRLEDGYYVNYTGVSALGVVTCLARTQDFKTFEKLGVIFGPDNKDVAIFPEKIGGRHYTLHRPAVRHLGTLAIWLASSENLLDWGRHRTIICPRSGKWDGERVGAGASPIRIPEGWLELYHGCDQNTRYCTGALLLDPEKPWEVIGRSEEPFLVPEAPYEREGLLPNIVFHSGLIENGDGTLDLYYGGGDFLTCGSRVSIKDILGTLK
jgi:beta-1,2-mannobiose phosphorylase / 1,2-beta-oligomannan phosphorylase